VCMRFLPRFPIPGALRGCATIWHTGSTCLVAAMLCGRNSTLAVAEWCRDEQELLKQLFGQGKSSCPDDSLYRKLLPRLDASQVEGALADWIRMTLIGPSDEPVALDGKTVRGAGTQDQKAPHLLSFCTHHRKTNLVAHPGRGENQ
jgi:hypothetical protein